MMLRGHVRVLVKLCDKTGRYAVTLWPTPNAARAGEPSVTIAWKQTREAAIDFARRFVDVESESADELAARKA